MQKEKSNIVGQRIQEITKNSRTFAFCLLPFAFCLLLSACGKVGAPIPPTRLKERATDLSAIQRGPKILLSWSSPSLSKKESSTAYIDHVDIYRLVERPDQDPVLDIEDYEVEADRVGFLDRAQIEALIDTLGKLQFTDAVNVEQARANTRLRYAVRYVNKRGQKAAFSNTVAIEPMATVALPPTNLQARATQEAVILEWNAPEGSTDGSAIPVVGYNIYRTRSKNTIAMGKPLNDEPITELQYADRSFQFKSEYTYIVRALTQSANGLIESADSDLKTFTPIDRFPPSAPDSLSAASANGIISLFWPTSPESDVIGYNVYRAESEDAEEWIKLTPQPSTATTFRDERVVIDKQYFYRVTAVDKFNNESQPSKVAGETAHP